MGAASNASPNLRLASSKPSIRAIVPRTMRTLILVRHGQYDHETGDLTALGRRQALATVRALRGHKIDAIHCSTLARAKETATLLKLGLRSRLKLRASSLLREKLPTPVPGLTKRADLPELRRNLATMQRLRAPGPPSARRTHGVGRCARQPDSDLRLLSAAHQADTLAQNAPLQLRRHDPDHQGQRQARELGLV